MGVIKGDTRSLDYSSCGGCGELVRFHREGLRSSGGGWGRLASKGFRV